MNDERPILVVDDDEKTVRIVRAYLERHGFSVAAANDGRSALAQIALDRPRLIVLDVMLPEVDGLSVLDAVRETSKDPVLMLSARGTVEDRIDGLERGADDYLVKPFSPAELVVRVRRLLERSADRHASVALATEPPADPLRTGDLLLDRDRHQVFVGDQLIDLTRAEFCILETLLAAGGRVLTRDQLIDAVHGIDGEPLARSIDVHVGRLRGKLGDSSDAPRYVATVRGVGYRAANL